MTLGVGFRVAPGVRLRATTRGPRISIGPRIARIHVGSGRTAVSTGRGPVTVWSTLSGGGQVGPTPPATHATHRKAEEWASTERYLDGLLTAHEAPVHRSTRPVAPPPTPVSRRAVRSELRRAATIDLPWWRLRAWMSARARAGDHLDAEVARRERSAGSDATDARTQADAWWSRLVANDPETVTEHLQRAFADHAMPATVAAVEEDGRVHLVLAALTVEKLIPPREPRTTEVGKLSLARMTKTRRHELYEATLHAAMVAVTAEAFALAPGLDVAELAVVVPDHLGGPAVLLLAELPRPLVLPDGADRPPTFDLEEAAAAGRATLVRDKGGRIGALRPLDDTDPDVRALLDALDLE